MKNGEKSFHKIFELIETIGRCRHGIGAKDPSEEVQTLFVKEAAAEISRKLAGR